MQFVVGEQQVKVGYFISNLVFMHIHVIYVLYMYYTCTWPVYQAITHKAIPYDINLHFFFLFIFFLTECAVCVYICIHWWRAWSCIMAHVGSMCLPVSTITTWDEWSTYHYINAALLLITCRSRDHAVTSQESRLWWKRFTKAPCSRSPWL